MQERFVQIVRFLLSPQLVVLDELQSTELDRALSKQRKASVSTANNDPPSREKARTSNIPSARSRAVSHAEMLERISLRLR